VQGPAGISEVQNISLVDFEMAGTSSNSVPFGSLTSPTGYTFTLTVTGTHASVAAGPFDYGIAVKCSDVTAILQYGVTKYSGSFSTQNPSTNAITASTIVSFQIVGLVKSSDSLAKLQLFTFNAGSSSSGNKVTFKTVGMLSQVGSIV
jgi:hypothetical protein